MMECRYTLSARGKQFVKAMPIIDYLRCYYGVVPLEQIDSVFGFVERSTLYGGRPFQTNELTEEDVTVLYQHGIGLRLPLTNHHVNIDEYENSRPFLDKYCFPGNTAIVTNDNLAKWIRRDYPTYEIEASVIKNIDNMTKLKKALSLYDTAVLPAKSNDDVAFLKSIQNKDRIRLFLNAGCAYNCPSKLCYPSVSKMNKYTGGEYRCSQPLIPREVGMHAFDVQQFMEMGFSRFKVLRQATVTAF
jgi:hypothetical protein